MNNLIVNSIISIFFCFITYSNVTANEKINEKTSKKTNSAAAQDLVKENSKVIVVKEDAVGEQVDKAQVKNEEALVEKNIEKESEISESIKEVKEVIEGDNVPVEVDDSEEIKTEEAKEKTREELLKELLREYQYSSEGRKDPFKSLLLTSSDENKGEQRLDIEPLEMFDLEQIQLMGIIWGVRSPKVMLKDPVGKIHVVEKNTKLGRNNGYIEVIREKEVIVVESFNSDNGVTYQTRILKLKGKNKK